MRRLGIRRAGLVGLLACTAASLFGAAPAQAAVTDPLFVFLPKPPKETLFPLPPPTGVFEGPCGMAVDSVGRFYVSDYYHDAIDVYDQNANYNSTKPPVTGATGYLSQYVGFDSLDGPCGLAFDASDDLYVNDYHRAVMRVGAGTTITGATVDGSHPTGVAVDPGSGYLYVDQRTYVAVFDESGAPVMDGGAPLKIGAGSLQDGYGVALSPYPGTAGRLYVPDAATNTVKVYDPALDKDDPVAEIDGSGTPNGEFVSLRDSVVAVDRVTGEVYVVDNLQPRYTERPQAIVHVFNAAGAYEGHLKFLVEDGLPVGLAVDNSATVTQGRVYVTSGNTVLGTIYAYGPGAASTAPVKVSTARLSLASGGSGNGTIQSSLGESSCSTSCEEELPAGVRVSLSAVPNAGSSFAGWSGACSGSGPSCEVRLDEAASLRATFSGQASPQEPHESVDPSLSAVVPGSGAVKHRVKVRRHKRAHHGHQPHRGKRRGR